MSLRITGVDNDLEEISDRWDWYSGKECTTSFNELDESKSYVVEVAYKNSVGVGKAARIEAVFKEEDVIEGLKTKLCTE